MNFFKIILFALCCIATNHRANAQTLHAIIVNGASNASDVSTKLVEKQFKAIASTLGIESNIVQLRSADCGVAEAITNLRCQSEDLVVFWYCGHGSNSQDNDFPRFTTCQDGQTMTLAHSDVVDGITNKGCRLAVVGFDCCNHNAPTRPHTTNTSPPNYEDIWRKLFLEHRGVVRMCSSEPNKFSYEVRGYGGVFTNSFFESLKDPSLLSTTTSQDAWDKVAASTKRRTNAKNATLNVPAQNPLFRFGNSTRSRQTTARVPVAQEPDQVIPRGAQSSNTPEAPCKGCKKIKFN